MKKITNLLIIAMPWICVYFIGYDKYLTADWWLVVLPFVLTWIGICFILSKKNKATKRSKAFLPVLKIVFFFLLSSMCLVLFVSHNSKIKNETAKFQKEVVAKINENSAYKVMIDGTKSTTKYIGDYASVIVDKTGITPLVMRKDDEKKDSFLKAVETAKIQDLVPKDLKNKQLILKFALVDKK